MEEPVIHRACNVIKGQLSLKLCIKLLKCNNYINNFDKILHSQQVVDEISGNFSQAIHGSQMHNKLQKACEVLQKLTAFILGFSESVQVSRR